MVILYNRTGVLSLIQNMQNLQVCLLQLMAAFGAENVFLIIATFGLTHLDIQEISISQFGKLKDYMTTEFDPRTAQVLDCSTGGCSISECFFCARESEDTNVEGPI